jgi:hypothetical protein
MSELFVAELAIHFIIIYNYIMLKRIKERFPQDGNKGVEKLNKYGFVPTTEELDTDMTFQELSDMKRKYDFQGEYHCSLCPKKLLNTEQELKEHLASKGHQKNVQHYFRTNKGELKKKIEELFSPKSKKIKRYSQKYQQLSWLTHYYRVKKELNLK